MHVTGLVIPAAVVLAVSSAFFGVVLARVAWADEASFAAKMKAEYKEIHAKDQQTIASMRSTMDTMRQTIDMLQRK
ncbi:hypothetical protein [Bradyrhizobium sp. SZCCHNRI1073]|uniref:hypothetical protein n=1 Tax=Bradyrhizobium sp. SZCCHNRI1073 TaxID=3057280 RepID=UPI002915E0E0|nr:hypothetical protein [Bradyrhizobium sp. SZCCHNRI1073]